MGWGPETPKTKVAPTLGWKTAQRRGCSAAQQAGTSARPAQSSSRLVLVRGGPRLECGSLVP